MNKFKEWLIIKGYSSSSVNTVLKAADYFIAWCKSEDISDATEVNHNDIIAYIQHFNLKGTSKKTIANYIIHLKKYFDWLLSEHEVSDNPCSNIKIKGIKRKVLHELLSQQELEQLYTDYKTEVDTEKYKTLKSLPPQHLQLLARKRNKIIVGLLVYQALRAEEIIRLQKGDVKFREGKLCVAGANRSNARVLKLESRQVFDLLDYINDTRKQILQHRNSTTPTQELFVTIGNSRNKSNMLGVVVTHLKTMNEKVKTLDQIRASVITQWLKSYNLRKVQIMAGHRYISSTEKYKANNLDELKKDINSFHPF
jgi:site-specific recombinase XerD